MHQMGEDSSYGCGQNEPKVRTADRDITRHRPLLASPIALSRIIQCAVERLEFPAGGKPARQGLLQPEAVGAAVEVTKLPKPSMVGVAYGGSASIQAVTRVNVEQAPKRVMWKPTRLNNGEGRRSR
jgi:hypothetical protein